ncbi:hypothetical protein [Desulfovermiculus halophilus]|uniref:hypothetical protein n=1 Tax=Desulfovermiculus halophilus TaxID=339722 RepID=UPI0004831B32|nr:hypothetical protein [Desulfovermiculus halophilus]
MDQRRSARSAVDAFLWPLMGCLWKEKEEELLPLIKMIGADKKKRGSDRGSAESAQSAVISSLLPLTGGMRKEKEKEL